MTLAQNCVRRLVRAADLRWIGNGITTTTTRYEHRSGLALESVVHHLQKHFKQIDRATVLYVVSTSRQGDTHRFAYDGSNVRSVAEHVTGRDVGGERQLGLWSKRQDHI